jgi:L-ascorbate metabolism protein UlaG (beta-lactamase superfamily)
VQLTKHAHACVSLAEDDRNLLIDPGTFCADAADLVAATDTVLITHEHFDHVNEEVIAAALENRADLTVYGPAAVVDRWQGRKGTVVAVAEGDTFTAAGFEISVFGDLHASIHRDVPQVANVGYFVGGVYHPGDAYHVPPVPVTTLLVPTSGPWTKLGETADYVRAVHPERAVQIHELLLSEIGQQLTATFLSPQMLTEVALTTVPPGDTITV